MNSTSMTTTNTSLATPDVAYNVQKLVSIIIYSLLGTMGILGNGLVLIVMIREKELRTITNLFIVNQSIIDMSTSILLLTSYIPPSPPLPKGQPWQARFVCSIWMSHYPFWGTFVSSTFNLVMITLERYLAVVYPTIYRNRINYRRAVAMTTVPWVLGFLYEIHWAAVNRYVADEDVGGHCIVFYENNVVQAFVGCTTFAVLYLIPLSVMAFVYISIIRTLQLRVHAVVVRPPQGDPTHPLGNNASRPVASVENRSGSATAIVDRASVNVGGAAVVFGGAAPFSYREMARKNVIKTLLVVSITYGICLTPNQVIYLYFNLGGSLNFQGGIFYFGVYLAFLNMCINPFIYTMKYHRFQKGVKKIFRFRELESNSTAVTNLPATNNSAH